MATKRSAKRRLPLLLLAFSMALIMALAGVLLVPPQPVLAQDLTQSFTTGDGAVTVRYPEGWVVDEFFGTVVLANSQAASDVFIEGTELADGQVLLVLLTPAAVAEELSFSGEMVESPQNLLDTFMSDVGEETSPVETLTLGDKTVARSSATAEGEEVVAYAVDFGVGGLGLVAQISLPGASDRFEDTTQAIIASMSAEELALPDESGTVIWQQLREITDDAAAGIGYSSADAVVIGPDDMIYVLDGFVGVHIYEPDGSEKGVIAPDGLVGSMSALAVDADGNLWTVDFMGTVTQFDTNGVVEATFSLGDEIELAFFGIKLVLGPDGNLYLLNPRDTEEEAIGEILVYTTGGELLRRFEIGSDEYFYEASIAFGPDGNLYVAEHFGENGIKVFDTEGNLLQEGIGASQLYSISGLAVADDGSMYTAIPDSPIYHFDSDGSLLGRFGQSQFRIEDIDFDAEELPAMGTGVFYDIGGMALLSTGDLIVVDANPTWWQLVRLSFGE